MSAAPAGTLYMTRFGNTSANGPQHMQEGEGGHTSGHEVWEADEPLQEGKWPRQRKVQPALLNIVAT